MSDIYDGGPAYPNAYGAGMSLRDRFAIAALQGMCAASDEAGTLVQHGYEWLSEESYAIADAMLRARREK